MAFEFNKGDSLAIRPHTSKPGKGLSYGAMTVRVIEEGRGGSGAGWDVYDGVDTTTGEEVSFYGFDVLRRIPKKAGSPNRVSRTDVLSKGLHTFEIVYVDYNGRRIGHYVTDPMSYERAKAHLVSLIKRSMARDKLVAGGYLVAADLGAGSEGRGRIR